MHFELFYIIVNWHVNIDFLINKQGKMDIIQDVTRLFTVRRLHYTTNSSDKCLINCL